MNETPRPVVEIGFGATWQTPDAEITWVEVTDQVHWGSASVEADRGRHSPVEEISVGNLTLALWDPDRRFDPFNEASPYAGQLKPGVPIRVWAEIPFDVEVVERITEEGDVRITEEGDVRVLEPEAAPDDLVIWRGFVTGWPRRYNEGTDTPIVPLTCYDGIDRLSRTRLPGSVVEVETLASGPIAYWPLTDGAGTDAIELVQGADGTYRREIAASRTELLAYDRRNVMIGKRPSGTDLIGQAFSRSIGAPAAFSVRIWVRVLEFRSGSIIVMWQQGDAPVQPLGGPPAVLMAHTTDINDVPQIRFMVNGFTIAAGSSGFIDFAAPGLADGQAHQFVFTLEAGSPGTLTAWMDGTDLGVPSDGVDGVDVAAILATLGAIHAGYGVTFSTAQETIGSVALGHFAIWDRVLTPEEIAADYAAGVDPWGGDLPGARIGRVLDLIGWPAERRNLAAGYNQLGPAGWDRDTAPIEHLRLVENTEAGRLFVDRHGDVTLQDWLWPFTEQTTPVLTLGDGPVFLDVEVDYDDEWVRNRVELSLQGGGTITISDEGSIDDFGASVLSRDVIPRSVAAGRWLAAWLLALNSQPQPRVPSVELDLGTLSLEDQITVLSADLGTRVALRLAEPTGDPTVLELIIEGIEHSIRDDEWTIRWFVAPAPAVDPADFAITQPIPANADDGTVLIEAATYSSARAGTGSDSVDAAASFLVVGQIEDGADFRVAQAFARFDLSPWHSVPASLDRFYEGVELVATKAPDEHSAIVAASSGHVRSTNATYSTARTGSNLQTEGQLFIGQTLFVGTYNLYESFVEFPVAQVVPPHLTIESITLTGSVVNTDGATWTVEARALDWGDTLTTGDWVAGGSLAALTLLASAVAPTTPGTITFTNEAALTAAVEAARAGGPVRMVLHSADTRTNTAPTGQETITIERDTILGAPLRLVIQTAEVDQPFVVEARLLTWDSPLDDSEFVPGADLATLPRVATYSTDDSEEWVFTSEAGFLDVIQAALDTNAEIAVVLTSSHQRTNTPPSDHDLVALRAREAGAANALRLRLVPKED